MEPLDKPIDTMTFEEASTAYAAAQSEELAAFKRKTALAMRLNDTHPLKDHIVSWSEPRGWGKNARSVIKRIKVRGGDNRRISGQNIRMDGTPGAFSTTLYDWKAKLASGELTDEGVKA